MQPALNTGELVLAPGHVHLWYGRLEMPDSQLQALAANLSEEENARAGRFYFPQHRNQYIAGRGLLRHLLSQYLGCDPRSLTFQYNPFGKPFLSGEDRIQFNLSHSNGAVLFAFSASPIGADIEFVRQEFATDEIARHFFSDPEVRMLNELAPEDRVHGFFHCWTRKEAYIKARGEGLSIPLHSFVVALHPRQLAMLLHVEGLPRELERWNMYGFSPEKDYAAAICVEGRIDHVARFGL